MLPARWVAKTGLSALDTISNNLANVSTTGFKRDRAEVQDLKKTCSVRVSLGTACHCCLCQARSGLVSSGSGSFKRGRVTSSSAENPS